MNPKYLEAFKPFLHGRPGADGECRAFCPMCEDPATSKSPSASFNFKHEVWNCFTCEGHGSFRALFRAIKDGRSLRQPDAVKKSGKTASNVIPIKGRPLPEARQLRLWHKKLLSNPAALRIMTEKRGLDKKTLKKYLIGYDGQRFTIPIYDEEGNLVNIRRYKANARSHADKMLSFAAGYGEARLYGFDTLKDHDTIYLAEGELDRLIALQNGIPAVTHTGGAKTFKPEWGRHFAGKTVYIGYDEDKTGDAGAVTATKILQQTAAAIFRVKLDTGIDGGDTTDFFVKQGKTKSDMMRAWESASPLFVGSEAHVVPTKGKAVSIEESKNPDYDEPVELTAMVSGVHDPPYYVPKQIIGTCDQSAGQKCSVCPFAVADGKRTMDTDVDDPRLLQFLDMGARTKHDLLVDLMGAKCKTHIDFEITQEHPVEVMSVTPSVAHRTEAVETPIQRTVYNVGTYKTPVNHLARIVGKSMADPRSQRSTFMGWHLEQVESDLETFKVTPAVKKRLERFRTGDGQSPLEKCAEIARDLEANVTLILGRPLLHIGYDLVWHSINSFEFEGKVVTKGWLECLCIGDTRTGKSETAQGLIKHYGAGILHSLETASLAGLVGGAQQAMGRDWMVTWGLIPLNDRRLVVLDEMSGMYANGNKESKGIIEAMSSVRSEGKAQVNKMAKGETSARTRLIWITNPLTSMSLSETSNGSLGALQALVRNPEDIARFDFVMTATSKDVPSAVINSARKRNVKHRYTAQACRDLVLWAWSRRADQVRFLKGVEEYIYAAAEDLGSRYVPDPPLVQIANVRLKVARIAVALAARTFSTDRTGEVVVVKRAHVRDAVRFLDEIYGQPAMGYKAHSEKIMADRRRAEKAKLEARKYLKKNPHLIEVLLAVGAEQFRKRDFEEFGGIEREDANVIIPKLLTWRLIVRKRQGYMMMEPALIEVLRELEAEGA